MTTGPDYGAGVRDGIHRAMKAAGWGTLGWCTRFRAALAEEGLEVVDRAPPGTSLDDWWQAPAPPENDTQNQWPYGSVIVRRK